MTDREKVISALHCRGQDLMIDLPACDKCDYQIHIINRMGCDFRRLCKDALALLKEQEPISPGIKQDCRGISYVCGACGATLYTIADTASAEYKIKHGRFCPECGRSVKFA